MVTKESLDRIDDQEEAAEALMRDFGLSYNAAMIHVIDCENRADPDEGDADD